LLFVINISHANDAAINNNNNNSSSSSSSSSSSGGGSDSSNNKAFIKHHISIKLFRGSSDIINIIIIIINHFDHYRQLQQVNKKYQPSYNVHRARSGEDLNTRTRSGSDLRPDLARNWTHLPVTLSVADSVQDGGKLVVRRQSRVFRSRHLS